MGFSRIWVWVLCLKMSMIMGMNSYGEYLKLEKANKNMLKPNLNSRHGTLCIHESFFGGGL